MAYFRKLTGSHLKPLIWGICFLVALVQCFSAFPAETLAPRTSFYAAGETDQGKERPLEGSAFLQMGFNTHLESLILGWVAEMRGVYLRDQQVQPGKRAGWIAEIENAALGVFVLFASKKILNNRTIRNNPGKLFLALQAELKNFRNIFIFRVFKKSSLLEFLEELIERMGLYQSFMEAQSEIMHQTQMDLDQAFTEHKAGQDPAYFPKETFQTALMYTFMMREFARFGGAKAPSVRAIHALSLLIAIVDWAVDQKMVTRENLEKIRNHLQDRSQVPAGNFEKVIMDLIDEIYREFPPETHPDLFWLLNQAYHVEVESSVRQKGSDIPGLFDWTALKGGLCSALCGYVALGGLTPEQIEYFIKFGILFQLTDDLSDITLDMRDGIETIFTQGAASPNGMLVTVTRLIDLYVELRNTPGLSGCFQSPDEINIVFNLCFNFLVLGAMARQPGEIGDGIFDAYSRYFPVSPVTLRHYGSISWDLVRNLRVRPLHPFLLEFYEFVFSRLPEGQPRQTPYDNLAFEFLQGVGLAYSRTGESA
ncbi:MAG: hypothetical protein JW774_10920 [Candidatus Aureabacteria bacterium]|nr:hypothetical protein [Candidatus Auribacterota bacterium]